MIQPIQTTYQGYKFRSRLEARWAVFFDTLGLRFEYEPQGYDINGEWYLPDFYLPELGYWIEVKPGKPYLENDWPGPGKQVYGLDERNGYVLYGVPGFWRSDCGGIGFEYEAFPAWDNGYLWCVCPDCGRVGLQFEGRSDRLPCKANGCPRHSGNQDRAHTAEDRRILMALLAARQARFEHGEHGSGLRARISGRYVMDARRLPY